MTATADLVAYLQRANVAIADQATELVEAHLLQARAQLAPPFARLGLGVQLTGRYNGMWEDLEGKLPPRVMARLTLTLNTTVQHHDIHLAVGAFHDPAKSECIFELCMLRAEVMQELAGHGDGQVAARLDELCAMIPTRRWRFDP
jgi:hypothetical protein